MTISPKLKRILTISEKQAVAALLTSSALAAQWHFLWNFNNLAGVKAVGQLIATLVIAREVAAWLPSVTKWANTDADPSALDVAEEKAKETVAAVQEAKKD